MSNSGHTESDFIKKVTLTIEAHLSEENFGVSELSTEIGMSRSNLLRKIQKHEGLSVSLFIRKIRLEHAMELILENNLTISEVAYEVGFSSVSYFITCFHNQFGYPPGEAVNRKQKELVKKKGVSPRKKYRALILFVAAAIVLIIITLQISSRISSVPNDKSIAILPFINDSQDTTNGYFINGVMEAILTDLQKIEDLKVVSRTSAEKYRDSDKTIPEIARELGVSYILEGSGQKYKDQVILNVQLIKSRTDEHIWAERYNRQLEDIFEIQDEIAKTAARKIRAVITPEEQNRIEKLPTTDLVAYDYYLKGREYFIMVDGSTMPSAIAHFSHAIEHDPEFSLAHAHMAIAYSRMDVYQAEKKYTDSIISYAEKALRYDPYLDQALIAKALYFINIEDYEHATPYLEKAVEVNPNSTVAINILSEFYSYYLPNTTKHLEYSLKGIQLDIESDSLSRSYVYLHIGSAFLQNGFIEEASDYLKLSAKYDPLSPYADIGEAYVHFAKSHDLKAFNKHFLKTLQKDTSKLDVIREVARSYYYLGDYGKSWEFYRKVLDIRTSQGLDRYHFDDVKIAYVCNKLGLEDESKKLLHAFKAIAEQNETIYKHLYLAEYYGYQDDTEKSLSHLELFAKEEGINFIKILFMELEPLLDFVIELPQFHEILQQMKSKRKEEHEALKSMLTEEGLI